METKRVFIESKNKTEDSNTETVYFDEPFINVKEIKLNSIQVHNSFHNISESLGNNKGSFTIIEPNNRRHDLDFILPDGFYINPWTTFQDKFNPLLNSTYIPEEIRGKIELYFFYDKNVNKIHALINSKVQGIRRYNFKITSNALKLLGFKNTVLLEIPSISDYGVKLFPYTNLYVHCNLANNALPQRDLLCMLPIDQKKKWWDTVTYKDLNCKFVPYKNDFNCIKLCITDKKGNHIDFNGYPIIYELEITQETLEQKPSKLDKITSSLKTLENLLTNTNQLLTNTNLTTNQY